MAEHLKILDPDEIFQLYSRPEFIDEERKLFFHLEEIEMSAMQQHRSLGSQVYFILQLGYFKACQRFFVFDLEDVDHDVNYIIHCHFPGQEEPTLQTISKPVRLDQQKLIMSLFRYRAADSSARELLFDLALDLSSRYMNPVYIFRQLLSFMQREKIVLPAYTTMQRLIESALQKERNRLDQILLASLSSEHYEKLEHLLKDQSKGFYMITWMQQDPSGFASKQIRQHCERKQILTTYYQLASVVIPRLSISNENIRHYGILTGHYSVYKINQFKKNRRALLLLCFIFYRYREINDTLVDAFRYYMRRYDEEVKKMVKDQLYKTQLKVNKELIKLPSILDFFLDDSIDKNLPFRAIKEQVLGLLGKEDILLLSTFISKNGFDSEQMRWEFYEQMQRKITYNLRYLMNNIDFEGIGSGNELIEAIHVVKPILNSYYAQKKVAGLPLDFIPKYLHKYLMVDGKFSVTRYEILLYQSIRKHIESGDLYVSDSFQFKSFDQDLIPLQYWEDHKNDILRQAGLDKFITPINHLLDDWEITIDEKLHQVNQSIKTGENRSIKLSNHKNGKVNWSIPYQAQSNSEDHNLYSKCQLIGIVPLLRWINEQTHFLEAFEHILEKRAVQQLDEDQLIACLLAYGTNHGLYDLAHRSNQDYHKLKTTAHNFVRLETLQQANKLIADATAQLPMFEHYQVANNTVHSSSDGQKYQTTFETINSRHSSKYFGLGKGVTAYTLLADHIPINARIIGAHEHESHYVFDLLYNNQTEIKPKIHSTDTHGVNQINFAILDAFGYQFAPRYKQFGSKAEGIVSFDPPGKYSDYVIKPGKKANRKLIEDQWDNILRIYASLAMKTTTQSTIVRKLSSFSRMNKTQQALWEYDNILKSNYMLDYIDSKNVRKNVQKALNRGESYHRIVKRISFAHEGKLRVHSMTEQQVWNDATRLLANAIIYFNTYLTSQILEHHQQHDNQDQVELIKKVSPVAWRHVNFYGTYDFNQSTKLDFESLIRKEELTSFTFEEIK